MAAAIGLIRRGGQTEELPCNIELALVLIIKSIVFDSQYGIVGQLGNGGFEHLAHEVLVLLWQVRQSRGVFPPLRIIHGLKLRAQLLDQGTASRVRR